MTSFVPTDEEMFPSQDIADHVLLEDLDQQIWALAAEELPTDFEQLEYWLQMNVDGFAIRELPTTIKHVDTLIKAVTLFGEEAKYLFDPFVEICEKPVYESKSNEKLTQIGMESIERLYDSILSLWSVCPITFKSRLSRVLRKIINGGRNPDDLHVDDSAEAKSPSKYDTNLFAATASTAHMQTIKPATAGNTRKARDAVTLVEQTPDQAKNLVVDIDYVYERLKSSGALRKLVEEFNLAAKELDYELPPPETIAGSNANVDPKKKKEKLPPPSPFKTKEEELAFYGVPLKQPESEGNTASDEYKGGETNAFSPTSSPSKQNNNRMDLLQAPMEKKVVMREYTQLLLDLMLDISNHHAIDCAAQLCQFGICQGVLVLLEKDFAYDNRDRRLSYGVEVMWNTLEAFFEYLQAQYQAGVAESMGVTKIQNPKVLSHNAVSITTLLEPYVGIVDLVHATQVLKTLLMFQINDGFRQSDKELRNEIMILLAIFAQFPQSMGYFISSQLLHTLVTYACVEEIGRGKWLFFIKPVANTRNFATTSDIDLEFKKQCWCLITTMVGTNDVDTLLCFAASPLMECYFQYLEFEPAPPSSGVPSNVTGNTQQQQTQQNTMQNSMLSHTSHPLLSNSMAMSQYSATGPKHVEEIQQPPVNLSASSILLAITQGNSKRGFIAQLTPSKLREFQLQAILCLLQCAPKVISEFERLHGPHRTLNLALKLVQQYQIVSMSASAANLNQQGLHDYQMIVYYSLLLLHRCLINSQSIRQQMEENNLLSVFLYIFIYSNHEESRAQAVRLMGSLCSHNQVSCQAQMKANQGILALLQPLKHYVTKRPPLIGIKAGLKLNKQQDGNEPIPDPYENPFSGEVSVLIVAILDSLNYVLVGNTTNELHFAEVEGIDILLDLLEISSFILRIQVLRLLSDLIASNNQLVTLFNCWRSAKTLRSAAQLLCHAWLDEESRLSGERKERGVLCDIFNPLGNHHWPLADYEVPITGFAKPDPATGNMNAHYYVGKDSVGMSQSVTVTKLASAILASRNAIQTNLPVHICMQALEMDTRVILSDLLGNIGMYDLYHIVDEKNPFKQYHEQANHISNDIGKQRRSSGRRARIASPTEDQQHRSHNQQHSGGEEEEGDVYIEEDDEDGPMDTSSIRSGTGFDDVKLSPREKQVLAVAKKYMALREGEWWRAVQNYVQVHNYVVPIESDAKLMNDRLEYAFDAAIATQTEQMELFEEEENIKKDDENQFIQQVLIKKNQQIKAEWLKRNARGGTKKKR